MKTPDPTALTTLRKAEVLDPVITGNASHTSEPSKADIASNASQASQASQDGKASTKAKFTIRLDEELLGRVRTAYLKDLANGFAGSLSTWAAHHLETAVLDAEARLNQGQPFQPVQSGSIPTGRI